MTMTFDSGFRFRRLILFLGSGLLGVFSPGDPPS